MSPLALILAVAVCAPAQTTFDGNWWVTTGKEQRSGFLAGYLDCGSSDLGHSWMGEVPWARLEVKVSEYFAAHPAERKRLVGEVMAEFSGLARRRSGGEEHPEKHGIFDAMFWWKASAEERRGFVEGYLECRYRNVPKVAAFRHVPEWYVPRITSWYGMTETGANRDRAAAKIADVMELLDK
jgi:hypothetical protein